VAANKEVRDAFRRHVASAGESLTWDVEAAGIPSALTPEMEAQQAAKQVPDTQFCPILNAVFWPACQSVALMIVGTCSTPPGPPSRTT